MAPRVPPKSPPRPAPKRKARSPVKKKVTPQKKRAPKATSGKRTSKANTVKKKRTPTANRQRAGAVNGAVMSKRGRAGGVGASAAQRARAATGVNPPNGVGAHRANALRGAGAAVGVNAAAGRNAATQVNGATGVHGANGANGASGVNAATAVNAANAVLGANETTARSGANAGNGVSRGSGAKGANTADGAHGKNGGNGATGGKDATGANGVNAGSDANAGNGANGGNAPQDPIPERDRPEPVGDGFVPNGEARDRMRGVVDQLVERGEGLGMDTKRFSAAANDFFDNPTPESWDKFRTEFDELQGIGPRSDAARAERERKEAAEREQSRLRRDEDGATADRLRDGTLTGEQFVERLGGDDKVFDRFREGDLNYKDLDRAYGDTGGALDKAREIGGRDLHDEVYKQMTADVVQRYQGTRNLDQDVGYARTGEAAQEKLDAAAKQYGLNPGEKEGVAKRAARTMEERRRYTDAHELVEGASREQRHAADLREVNQAAARLDPDKTENFDAIRATDRRQQDLYDEVRNAKSLTPADVERLGREYDEAQKQYLANTYGADGPAFGEGADGRAVNDYLSKPGSAIVDEAILRRAEHRNRTGLQRGELPNSDNVDAMFGRAANNPDADLRDLQIGHPANPNHKKEGWHRTELRNHDLTGRDLTGSDLRNTRLSRMNLQDANLTGADLTGAQLDRTNLGGVDLRTVRGLKQADLKGAYYDGQTKFPHGFDPKAAGMMRMVTPKDDFATHQQHTAEMFRPQLNARTLQEAGHFPNPLFGDQGQPLTVGRDTFFDNRQQDLRNTVRDQASAERKLLDEHGGWAGAQRHVDGLADRAARDVLTARGLDPTDPENAEALRTERAKARENVSQMLLPMHAEAAQRAREAGLEGKAFDDALGKNFSDIEKERWRAAGGGDGLNQAEIDRYYAGLPQDRLAAEAAHAWDDELTPEQREATMGRMIGERADLAQGVLNGFRDTQRAISGTRTSLHENASLAFALGGDYRDVRTAEKDSALYGQVSNSLDHGREALDQIRDRATNGNAAYADAMFRDMISGEGAKGPYRPFEHTQQALKRYAEDVQPSFEDLQNAALRGGVGHIAGMAETAAENPGTTAGLAAVTAAGLYFAPEVALPVLFAVGAKSAYDNVRQGMDLYQQGMKNNNMNQVLAGAGHFGAAGVDTAFLAADGAATLNAFKSMQAVRGAKGLSVGQYAKYQLAERSANLGRMAQNARNWVTRKPQIEAPPAGAQNVAPRADVAPEVTAPRDGPLPGSREHHALTEQLQTKQTRLDRMRRGLAQRETAGGALPGGRGHGIDGLPSNATPEQARAAVKKLEAEIADLQRQVGKIEGGYLQERQRLEGLMEQGYHGRKPAYEHATHHDPSHPDFRGRGSLTTPIPADAAQVYRNAVPDPSANGRTWWGRGENGDLYRFQSTPDGKHMHWNGATGKTGGDRAIAMDNVPGYVRQRLGLGETTPSPADARALEAARTQLRATEEAIDGARAQGGYAGTAKGTLPDEPRLMLDEMTQMWDGRMPKLDSKTAEALRNLEPNRRVQVDMGNGPEWTTVDDAIRRAYEDPNVGSMRVNQVEPRASSLVSDKAVRDKFPNNWLAEMPASEANKLHEAVVTFDSGERAVVSGSRQMLEEIASSPNVRTVDNGYGAAGWTRPLSEIPLEQRVMGYDAVGARMDQLGDVFRGKPSDVTGLPVRHGTVQGLADSVRGGPQDVGKGFGGPGLYLFGADDAHLARNYAEFARDAAGARAREVGAANVDPTPTVLEGHIANDPNLRVGRFTLKRDGAPDFANGVLPATWADDPLLVQAMLAKFDVLDVRGAKAAGLNLDTDRFFVVHGSAGPRSVLFDP